MFSDPQILPLGPPGSFTDLFPFELQLPPNGVGNLVSNSITGYGHTISSLTMSLFSCPDVFCGTYSSIASTNTTSVDGLGSQTITLAVNGLSSGYYFLEMMGSTVDTHTGYAGIINVTDPPVADTPLPGALALFASGLGTLGLLGWNGKRKPKLVS